VQSVQLAPQCLLSVDGSTQLPPQLFVPGKQSVRHVLPAQTLPAVHAVQLPQWAGSFAVTTHTPAQDRL
jgi:hypothetical protein